jgi:predicted dehydrogenase
MPTANDLRVGFIGTGWTERVQIPAFRIGGLTAQAICSGRKENAQRVADKFSIPEVYSSWEELVNADSVDIVSIAAPPALHGPIAIAALKAGKHVICEKPMALNVLEAETMLAAAQAAPNQLAIVDHELRFTPQRQKIRQLFRENYVGRAIWLEMSWLSGHRLNPDLPWTWWSEAEAGGGMLAAIGSHLIDLGRWMFGHIDAISVQLETAHHYRIETATNVPRRVTADDLAHIDIKFGNGIDGALTASSIAAGRKGTTITLYGTDGALYLDEQDRLWGMSGDNFPNGKWEEIPVDDPVAAEADLPNQNPFARGSVYLARAVANALSNGDIWISEAASFFDGLKVQQILEAGQRSHVEKTWIML